MKFKKGDKVIVIAGKNKGESGIVKELFPRTNKIIVEGINIVTKHKKPTHSDPEGGRETLEAPIDASNIMLNIAKGKQKDQVSKIKLEIQENQKGKKEKIRVAKKTGIKI